MKSLPFAVFGAACCFVCNAHADINAWSQTGPEGGKVGAVLYVPGKSGTLLAVATPRVLRSTDNGVTWTSVLTFEPQGFGNFLVANPQNPNHIVMSGALNGAYVSDDAGLSFKAAASDPANALTQVLALNYSPDGSTIYAGVQSNKVSRSTDGGLTWTAPTGNLPQGAQIRDVSVSPTNANTLWVAADGNVPTCGGFKSTDGGVTFTQVWTQQLRAIAYDPHNANTIVGGGYGGLYGSLNGGQGIMYTYENDALLRFDPTVAGRVFAVSASGRILRSVDGGQNFSSRADLKTIDALSFTFDTTQPGRLAFASSEGVMVSDDDGASWQRRNAGFFTATFGKFRQHAETNTLYAGGYGPLGVFRLETNGSWSSLGLSSLIAIPMPPGMPPLNLPDGGVRVFAVTRTNASTLYIGRTNGILASNDSGASWFRPSPSFSDTMNDVAVDPTDPLILYAATASQGIMRSLNGGATWAPRSTGIAETNMALIVIDPKNPATLYAAGFTPNSFYKTIDAGLTWTPLSLSATQYSIFKIALDPSDSNTLYVTSFGNTGLWRSRDGGATWSKRYSSFGFLSDLVIDRQLPKVLYLVDGVGTTSSIQRSVDAAETFEKLGTLSSQTPNSVAIDPRNSNNVFISATERGIWQFEIANDLQMSVNGALTANSSMQSVTLQLSNRGVLSAVNAKASIDAPPGSSSVNATADKGGVCTVNVLHVECVVDVLKSSEAMTITLSLNPGASSGGTLSAASSARESDPVAANNSATLIVQAPPPPPPTSGGGGGGGGSFGVLQLLALLLVHIARRRNESM